MIVAKADKTPLTVHELGGIVDYASNILDAFGDTGGPPVRMYDKARGWMPLFRTGWGFREIMSVSWRNFKLVEVITPSIMVHRGVLT